MTRMIDRMAIVGTGVMGSGIAQIAAQAGIQVKLFDAREGAAQVARDNLERTLGKLADKGKISGADVEATHWSACRWPAPWKNWLMHNWWSRPSLSAWMPNRRCSASWKP